MSKKLWGGRFSKKIDPYFEKFSSSIKVDKRLAKYDCISSLIHVKALEKSGFISKIESKKLSSALFKLLKDIEKGKFRPDLNQEDIHTNIQNIMEKKVGKLAYKLHTLRSRNDQVVFDTKFYSKEETQEIKSLIKNLINSLSDFAKKNKNITIPGYTHLQHAQPVKLSYIIDAYSKMLERDYTRLEDMDKKIKLYLGSGAFRGTPISTSHYIKAAKEISCKLSTTVQLSLLNSVDNVSDRDFVIEILSALAILGMHLSRISEDFIIFSTKEFGFIEIPEEFSTGSSFMPQKKNPDSLELIRGNTGRLYGNLVSLLTTMKGLPLTYNRDMQLDKEPLFNSIDIIKDELKILTKLIKGIKLNRENIKKQLEDESLYAVDLAEYLVKKKVPFKEAHNIVGRLIRYSLDKNKKIKEMDDKELKKFSPRFIAKDVKALINKCP